MSKETLPLPPHFNPVKVGDLWMVSYEKYGW